MASTNKTTRLQLNKWEPDDSPMRADFNADNDKIDAAVVQLEQQIASAGQTAANDLANARATLDNRITDVNNQLKEYNEETRRYMMNMYNAMVMDSFGYDFTALDPRVSGLWVEKFDDLKEMNFTHSDYCNRNINTSRPYRLRNGFGTTFPVNGSGTTGTAVYGIPFELDKPATIRTLTTSCVWNDPLYRFGMYIYRATKGTNYDITLGELVWSRELTSIGCGSYRDNLQGQNIHLEAGFYVYAMGGGGNQYYLTSITPANLYNGDDLTSTYPVYGGMGYTVNTSTRTITKNPGVIPDISVTWDYDDGSKPLLYTKPIMLDSDTSQQMSRINLYVYTTTDDFLLEPAWWSTGGVRDVYTADPKMQFAQVGNGMYVSRFVFNNDGVNMATRRKSKIMTEIKYDSPSGGQIAMLVVAANRYTG